MKSEDIVRLVVGDWRSFRCVLLLFSSSSQQFLEACLRTTVEEESDDILQYSEENKR